MGTEQSLSSWRREEETNYLGIKESWKLQEGSTEKKESQRGVKPKWKTVNTERKKNKRNIKMN